MQKNIFIAFLLLLYINNVHAQKSIQSFKLEGSINADSGQMMLMAVSDTAYYPYPSTKQTTVVNGKFTFSGPISYPSLFMLGLRQHEKWKYLSGTFYVDPGDQKIVCNTDSLRTTPLISNETMNEWQSNYQKRFGVVKGEMNQLSLVRDSLKRIYGKNIPPELLSALSNRSDSLDNGWYGIMYDYTKTHSNSYVVLWALVQNIRKGYEPIVDSIYEHLSTSVRHTPTGLLLANKIRDSHVVTVGSAFPQLHVSDTSGNKVMLVKLNTHKYTLIDFWFSHCGPCRQQFPALKKMYEQYKNKGFEIIGISVDKDEYLADWKKTIQEKQLIWPQYLDKQMINAKRLSIETYPTNFLLDENGTVVMRDIKPEELEKKLQALDTLVK